MTSIDTWMQSGRTLVAICGTVAVSMGWIYATHDLALQNQRAIRRHSAILARQGEIVVALDKTVSGRTGVLKVAVRDNDQQARQLVELSESVSLLKHDTKEMADDIKYLKRQSSHQIRLLERIGATLKIPTVLMREQWLGQPLGAPPQGGTLDHDIGGLAQSQ